MAAHKITFTYLNIRQSIVILLARLILIDVISAIITIGFYFMLMQGEEFFDITLTNTTFFLVVFITLGVVKIFLGIYIVLQWLNEYYEITPEYIIHKKGIIFKKQEQYRIDNIRVMDIHDTFVGELFKFATISLYDIRLNKYLDMYLVHNPKRYAQVLCELRPHIEMKKDRVALPFMPKEDNNEEMTLRNMKTRG